MKCAVEIIGMKAVAIAEYELEECRKDVLAAQRFEEMKNETIQFCDSSINDAFIEKAANREELKLSFKVKIMTDRLGNKYFQKIKKASCRYADGSPSYEIDDRNSYAFDSFIEYLEKHCFTVEVTDDSYRCYGFGSCDCALITVTITEINCEI